MRDRNRPKAASSSGPRLIAALFAIALAPASLAAQEVTGVWRTEPTERGFLEIEMTPCGAAVCGTILRARDRQGRPQTYEHSGRRMIWDMIADGEDRWRDGRIWDPRTDRTFRSRMELSGDRLVVSGCILGICQTQTWERAD